VAQEDVDVLVLERGVGDRHRKHLYVRAVAQRLENDGGGGRGGGDVRPADICEMYSLAAFRLGREARTGSQEIRQADAGGDRFYTRHFSSPIMAQCASRNMDFSRARLAASQTSFCCACKVAEMTNRAASFPMSDTPIADGVFFGEAIRHPLPAPAAF